VRCAIVAALYGRRKGTAVEDLDQYVAGYTDFNDWLMRQRYQLLADYFTGANCLEFGSATGDGTAFLLEHFDRVVAVDGSQPVVDKLVARFGPDKLTAVCSYFEDFDTDERFDTIVLAHILEHVDRPDEVLAIAKRLVKPDGVIIVDVPNAMSLHRQIGVELGMLGQVTDLNEGDLSIGHKRVYTPEAFRAEIEDAGLVIREFGGVFLKILSNAQSDRTFSAEQLAALITVGRRYPEIAAEIYAVATLS
jgi:2-polyprenyl-3-methyl-5-hydroxy-6-metoxy-1,4-benzoquinol methylase